MSEPIVKQAANVVKTASNSLSKPDMAKFIPRRQFPDYRVVLAQFKGHQNKALQKMTHLAPQINLVVELRDARSPLSTSNVLIDKVFRNKDKLILYTKNDMSPLNNKLLKEWHTSRNEDFMAIDCKKSGDVNAVLKELRRKFSLVFPPPPLGLRLMVVGMPNVGKSTLVNGLRKFGMDSPNFKKVAKTGNLAGVTRNTSEIIRISSQPEILLYDTPGVLLPQVNDIKTMLSLYMIGTVSNNEIDPVIAADYLLYMMNLADRTGKGYKKYLSHPTNDIYELLDAIGKKTGNRNKRKIDGKFKTNYVGCALELVTDFQQGRLGKWCLDEAVVRRLSGDKFTEHLETERQRVEGMKSKLRIGELDGGSESKSKGTSSGSNSNSSSSNSRKSAWERRQARIIKQSNQLFV
jgi:mitochondrial GTPase 1